MQSAYTLEQITQLLSHDRALPTDPLTERVVLWKVFRDKSSVVEYSHHILLESDQRLVGGQSVDTIGTFYWLGVEVEDIENWGNTQAIQLSDPFDGDSPKVQGQGFGSPAP